MLEVTVKVGGVIVIFNQATNVEPRPPLSSWPLYQTQEVTLGSKDTVPTSLTSIRHCKFATASQWKRLRMCIDRQPVATTYMRYFSGVDVSLKVCSQHMNWTKLNSSNEDVYSSGNVHSARTNWALIVPVSLQPINFVTLMCVTSERAVM